LIANTVLSLELSRNRNVDKRRDSLKLLSYAGELRHPDYAAFRRAEMLEASGYGATAALHLACAEQAGADILLTTDDASVSW
jgi:hypothetical protein